MPFPFPFFGITTMQKFAHTVLSLQVLFINIFPSKDINKQRQIFFLSVTGLFQRNYI